MIVLTLCSACALVTVAKKVGVAESSAVTGIAWKWVETSYTDGRTAVPSDPRLYTLSFLDTGEVSVKADCNMKGGRYTIIDNRLSMKITHSTMAACMDGSLEDQFVRDLSVGSSMFLKDGDLHIALKSDSGTMKFVQQHVLLK
jgi:heat shock protein HslJ